MTERKQKLVHASEYIPISYQGRRVPVTVCTGDETLVEQCHRETTNINKIIGRYRTSGHLPENREGQYADVSNVGEFMDVQLQMQNAMAAFNDLPPNIRDQFADPQEFLEYVEQHAQQHTNDGDTGEAPEAPKPVSDGGAAPAGAEPHSADPPANATT